MSYTKHTWQSEEIITADKLNNMEEGISSFTASNAITGYLQDGDILTVQTSDGNSKKIIWKEINVPLTLKKDDSSISIEEVPDIDSSVDIDSLFKLLNSKAEVEIILNKLKVMSSFIDYRFTSTIINKTYTENNDQEAFLIYNSVRHISGTNSNAISDMYLEVSLYKDSTYKKQYIIGYQSTPNGIEVFNVDAEFNLLVKGFLPVEN